MASLLEKFILLGLGGSGTAAMMFAKPIAAWWAAYWQKRSADLLTPAPAPAVLPLLDPPLSETPALLPDPPLPLPPSPALQIQRRQSEDMWEEVEGHVQLIYEEFLADRVTLVRYQWSGSPGCRQLTADCLYEAKIPKLRSVKRDYRGGIEVTEPILSLIRRLQVEGNLYLADIAQLTDPALRSLLSYYGTKAAYYHVLLLNSGGEPIGCLSVSWCDSHTLTDPQLAGLRQSARVLQRSMVAALQAEEALAPA